MIRPAALVIALGGSLLTAQVRLSLSDAAARGTAGETLQHAGEAVIVRGTVAAGPIAVTDYAHMAIQDQTGAGLVLEAPLAKLESCRPGGRIEARGTITHRAGLPVLRPERIDRISQESPPQPQPARIVDLNSPGLLGRWVETEGRVTLSGSNRGGETLRVSDGQTEITVFFPFLARRQESLSRYQPGDRVRVRGIASQYAPLPPHRGSYQLMIGDAGWVSLMERRALLPPWSAGLAFGVALLVLLLWYARERRMAKYPRRMRRLYNLGEALLGCRGLGQSVTLLTTNLPALLGVTSVRLYLYEPVTSTLRRMGCDAAEPPVSLKQPQGFRGRALALCFNNKTPIVLPDSRRSTLLEDVEDAPRSLLAVPLLAQGRTSGVLELANETRPCRYSEDEVAAVQHLANQIAIGMRLLERQSLREQAGGGQQCPALLHVAQGALRELDRWLGSYGRDQAGHEASRSTVKEEPRIELPARVEQALERLRRFCTPPPEAPVPVDFTALVRKLLDQYSLEWRDLGWEAEAHLSQERLMVEGMYSPALEELAAALFAGVTRLCSVSSARRVRIRLGRLAGAVLLEVGTGKNGPARLPDPFEEQPEETRSELPLTVARAMARNLGGELRWIPDAPSGPSLELELPFGAGPQRRPPVEKLDSPPPRVLTVLALEPNERSRQALLALIGRAGHRCVATGETEQAADMLTSGSFDVFFCARRISGRSWEDLYELSQRSGVPFVLLTAERDLPDSAPFAGGTGYALAWPGPRERVFQVLAQVQAGLESLDRYNGE